MNEKCFTQGPSENSISCRHQCPPAHRWADDRKRLNKCLKTLTPAIHKTFRRLTQPQDREDLAQEVMVRALEQSVTLAHLSEEAMGNYIWGIVHKVLCGHYGHARSVGAWPREAPARLPEGVDDLDGFLSEQEILNNPHARFDNPETNLFYARKMELVERASQFLSDEEKTDIKTWDTHMKMKAICQAKGFRAPPALLPRERTAIHRALKHLAELIAELQRGS